VAQVIHDWRLSLTVGQAEAGHTANDRYRSGSPVYVVSLIVIWTVLRNFTGAPFAVAGL
jgi:hypothetical protein